MNRWKHYTRFQESTSGSRHLDAIESRRLHRYHFIWSIAIEFRSFQKRASFSEVQKWRWVNSVFGLSLAPLLPHASLSICFYLLFSKNQLLHLKVKMCGKGVCVCVCVPTHTASLMDCRRFRRLKTIFGSEVGRETVASFLAIAQSLWQRTAVP